MLFVLQGGQSPTYSYADSVQPDLQATVPSTTVAVKTIFVVSLGLERSVLLTVEK